MTAGNDGAAREVAPGRLANFEDGELPDVRGLPGGVRDHRNDLTSAAQAIAAEVDSDDVARPTLPARPGRGATTPTAPGSPAPQRPAEPATPAAPAARTRRGNSGKRTPAAAKRSPAAPDPGTKGPEQRPRPSNVHIPIALLEPIAAKKAKEGLSNGEIIICAIEATYDRLPNLVQPVPTAGGSVFASRRSRPSRTGDGPLTPLNYRLPQEDFDTLDKLVEQFSAVSRGRLITVALTAYFGPTS